MLYGQRKSNKISREKLRTMHQAICRYTGNTLTDIEDTNHAAHKSCHENVWQKSRAQKCMVTFCVSVHTRQPWWKGKKNNRRQKRRKSANSYYWMRWCRTSADYELTDQGRGVQSIYNVILQKYKVEETVREGKLYKGRPGSGAD